MQASARSTWLAVGLGRDSLLFDSQNNTLALPAPLVLLRSSSLVAVSSRCPLAAIQSHLTLVGCLWSLACQSISLGNKANRLPGPSVFLEFLHSLPLASCFICLGYLVRLLTHSWVCQMKVHNKYVLSVTAYSSSSFLKCPNCLSLPGSFHDGSKNTGMFYVERETHSQQTLYWQCPVLYSGKSTHLRAVQPSGLGLLNQGICGLNVFAKGTLTEVLSFTFFLLRFWNSFFYTRIDILFSFQSMQR